MKRFAIYCMTIGALNCTFDAYSQSKTISQYETVQLDSLKSGSSLGVDLLGDNVRIGMWEVLLGGTSALVDTTISDLSHVSNRDSGVISTHATTVAKIIASKGIGSPSEIGVAPDATLYNFDLTGTRSDFALEFSQAVENLKLLISNHSYSENNGWQSASFWSGVVDMSDTEDYKFGYYGDWSRTYDSLMFEHPYHLIVRAVFIDRGDIGSTSPFSTYETSNYNVISRTTPYPEQDGGSDGFDGLSRDATAKNALLVGAVDYIAGGYSTYTDISFTNSKSAWGLTDDGRIKPDVVGPGQLGISGNSPTSYSTAIVTGLAALAQELYHDEHGRWLKSSSVKGALIHTADPASANGGPTAKAGWGLVNAKSLGEFLLNEDNNKILLEAELENGETDTYRVYLDGTTDFRATLVWTDPKGTSPTLDFDGTDLDDSTPILVHDLDIELWNTSGPSLEVQPWVMDVNNPGNAATKSDNDVDNVERLDWNSGSIVAGWYTIRVSHEGTLTNPQEYSLLISDASGITYSGGSWSIAPSSWSGGEFVQITDTSNIALLEEDVVIGQLIMNPCTKLRVAETNSLEVLSEAFLKADSTGMAQLKGLVKGTVVHQAYIKGSADYRFISSPVKTQVQDWLEDLYIANVAGSASSSLYHWDAGTSSWASPQSTDSVHLLNGLVLYFGTNANGQFSLLPMSKTAKGKVRDRHETLTLETDSDSDPGNSEEGWNLISNPYLAALDWSELDVSQTSGSWYVWNPDQDVFASSDGSNHINSGTAYIPPAQSFWVYCPNTSSGMLLLDSGAVTLSQNPQTFKGRDQIRITWFFGNGMSEEVLLGFSSSATTEFRFLEDQPKRFSGSPDRMEAFWNLSGIECSFSEVQRGGTDSIPLSWMNNGILIDSVIVDADLSPDLRASWDWKGVEYPLNGLPAGIWNSDSCVYLKWSNSKLGLREEDQGLFVVQGGRVQYSGNVPVDAVIMDVSGRAVQEMHWTEPGWRSMNLSSGVYFFRASSQFRTSFLIP